MDSTGVIDEPVFALGLLGCSAFHSKQIRQTPEVSRTQPIASSTRQVPSVMSTFTG
jgi:hypothetical protein